MKQHCWILLPVFLCVSCDTIKGPNQSYIAPQVEGRVVNADSGDPLQGARVRRYLGKPTKPDPLAEKGAQRLMIVPTGYSDEQGNFRVAPERGGYLLLEPSPVYDLTLVVWHAGHHTLTTNIDLMKIRPVKTNKVLTVFVGDLPLVLQAE